MTSYTRKLHHRDPDAAKHIHRLRYGKHTTLLTFTLGDRQDAEIAVEHRAARRQLCAGCDGRSPCCRVVR